MCRRSVEGRTTSLLKSCTNGMVHVKQRLYNNILNIQPGKKHNESRPAYC